MPPRKWSTKAPIELKRKTSFPIVAPDPNRNFFDGSRPGQPVLRPADLLALRIELRNLAVTPGQPPRLKKAGSGVATLIVHFPPQSITEHTFFERPAGNLENPSPPRNVKDTPSVADTPVKPEPADGSPETPDGPPVRARIAGESRASRGWPLPFPTASMCPTRWKGCWRRSNPCPWRWPPMPSRPLPARRA